MIVKYCSFRQIMLSSVLMFCVTFIVHAQIEVSTLAGNDSKGSLIAAIKLANAQKSDPAKPVTIRFARNLKGEIVLTMDLPPIENHISFAGNLENAQPAITINGSVNPDINEGLKGGISPGFRLFVVRSGKTLSFENLHLTKSNRSGITNEGGQITVNHCMFTYNLGMGSIHGTAGAIQNEKGNCTVIGSDFFYNTGGVGGTDGSAGNGGAGAINVIDGNAVVINSSFIENEGGFGGVGVGSVGGAGAIMVRNGNVSVANCTVAGNFGGGSIVTGASGGMVFIGGNTSVLQSTIVDNMGGVGLGGFDGVDFCSGGIHVLSGNLTLAGNIIAGNHNGADEATDIESQASGKVNSLGGNIFGAAKVEINATDAKGVALKNVVATDDQGKHKTEIVTGFLPTIALTTNSPAKGKSVALTKTAFLPVASDNENAKFFEDGWKKYASLLESDQNGKKRGVKGSAGAVE